MGAVTVLKAAGNLMHFTSSVCMLQRAFLLDNKSQIQHNRFLWVLTSPYMICNPLVDIPAEHVTGTFPMLSRTYQ